MHCLCVEINKGIGHIFLIINLLRNTTLRTRNDKKKFSYRLLHFDPFTLFLWVTRKQDGAPTIKHYI
jgi:hypothetical protein